MEDILLAQIEAIKQAKKNHIPIIFLEYDGFDATSEKLKNHIKEYPNVKIFKKDTDGMFDIHNSHRKDLIEFLKQNNVRTLVITGANGGACVERSIVGALNGNCDVVAFTHGIADFNYLDFIYPYTNQYDRIKPSCKDCSFREVSSIADVGRAMTSSNKGVVNKIDPGLQIETGNSVQ